MKSKFSWQILPAFDVFFFILEIYLLKKWNAHKYSESAIVKWVSFVQVYFKESYKSWFNNDNIVLHLNRPSPQLKLLALKRRKAVQRNKNQVKFLNSNAFLWWARGHYVKCQGYKERKGVPVCKEVNK